MASLLGVLRQRFFDDNGEPLAGGKVFSYQAGTSTPLATFVDEAGVAENDNPTILDSSGKADIWLKDGNYKFVITDANDIVIDTIDNVTAFGLNVIPTDALADGSVTTPKLADGSVTTAKLADDSVTTDKIDEDAVRTPNIQNGAVTQLKRAALGQQISSSSDAFSTATSGSDVDITNLSVTITTTGRPVFISLIQDGSATFSRVGAIYNPGALVINGGTAWAIKFKRDGTTICTLPSTCDLALNSAIIDNVSATVPPSSFVHIDLPSAGTYTYKASIYGEFSTSTYYAERLKLVVFEL